MSASAMQGGHKNKHCVWSVKSTSYLSVWRHARCGACNPLHYNDSVCSHHAATVSYSDGDRPVCGDVNS